MRAIAGQADRDCPPSNPDRHDRPFDQSETQHKQSQTRKHSTEPDEARDVFRVNSQCVHELANLDSGLSVHVQGSPRAMVIVESSAKGTHDHSSRGDCGPRPYHDSRFRICQERRESHQSDCRDDHSKQMETERPDP